MAGKQCVLEHTAEHEQLISRQRWATAVAPRRLELINPPEDARTYSNGELSDGADLSVLGSTGEWKVASSDQTRWLIMSLGGLQQVHAIVLQSGSLVESFSGWVTVLRVAHCEEEELQAASSDAWIELGRDLVTGCSSDPVREHRVFLREPIWTRHIKLTPITWKVAGLISSGDNLVPRISMRAAVLAAPRGSVPRQPPPPDAVTHAHMRASEQLSKGGLVCLFNLHRGFDPMRTTLSQPAHSTDSGGASTDSAGMVIIVHPSDGSAPRVPEGHPAGRLDPGSESVCFEDKWLVGSEWLARDGTCNLALKDEGGNRDIGALAPLVRELEYVCARGCRVALCSPHSIDACATIVHVEADHAVVCVDNTRSLKAFRSWAAGHYGKMSRGILHGVSVELNPLTVVLSTRICYQAGARLLLLHKGALIDVRVDTWLGPEFGNLHRVACAADGKVLLVDLNDFNHSVQTFEHAAALQEARGAYCEALISKGRLVEDAVTGRKLKIEEQLLNITMATGEGAVRAEGESLASVAAEDLEWSLGSHLSSGDRVRCGGRLGFIGWKNDEGARTFLGRSGEGGAAARLYCGRNHTRGRCGGSDGAGPGNGSGRPCDACQRLMAEVTEEVGSSPNWRMHHVEYDSGTPKRSLALANQIERASSICGVHVPAWNGATFRSGDVVIVANGHVTHKRTGKTVPLAHSYRPLPLSTLPNARTSTVELVRGNSARRVRGEGGVVITEEPLRLVNGQATFEVVVKKYAGNGNEGLEIGVTTTTPQAVNSAPRGSNTSQTGRSGPAQCPVRAERHVVSCHSERRS